MKLALLVLFAGTALAAPFWVLDENLPRAEVKEVGCAGNRFRKGQTQVYEYAGETLNTIEGSAKRTTGLKLKATVLISTLSECKFMMTLRDVELFSKSMNQDIFTSNADTGKMKKDLESFTLGFSLNGNMITSIYANENDQVHTLNIKRGILSTLQVDETAVRETDINGDCNVALNVDGNTIVKTKDLSKCSQRAQNEIALQTSTFKSNTDLKPLDSTSKCTYTLSGNKIDNVQCLETHLFKPFSAGYETPSGAMTTVKQTTTFKGTKNNALQRGSLNTLTKRTTLLFDHTNEDSVASNTLKDQFESVMMKLADPAQKTKLSAKQDSAHEFSSLVFLLRKMDEKRMRQVWVKYFDCMESGICSDTNLRDVYNQYLMDAVSYCGTSTCITMVHDAILAGKLSGERMNMFLQSIALVSKTTVTMIDDVLSIARKQPSRHAFLTLGTLMARHCATSPKDCKEGSNTPISKAEVFLHNIIGEECEGQEQHERVEELLMALKAVGNAKRPINIQNALLKCAKKSLHANITSSIFDAFRGMPCDSMLQKELTHFLNEKTNDDESRIHAFITLMKCPTTEVLQNVVRTLEGDQSKHLTSFMWSHLSNIMESSDPANSKAKEIIGEITKTKPLRVVDLPFYQFSKSFEKSLHSAYFKSGATAQGHVIYNKDKFLPKMGMLNMKANLMGYPINMLEAKVGVDGLETVLETLVGANGMVPEFNINLGRYGNFSSEFVKRILEKKRKNENNNVKDNLTKMHMRVNKKITPPNAHLSVKVMDQEVKMLSYDDILWMIDQIDNMNVVQIAQYLAKGGHKTLSKSLMFLEMTHIVPTGLGLPLKLKLVGSSVSTLELNGKFDIRNMFWGPRTINVNGYVQSSSVLELSGQMGIESHYVSTGMFVNSSMFMSEVMKGAVEYKHGQILKVNLDTPDEPIQLVNFSSTPFMFMNEKSELIEGTLRKINPDFCMKSQVLGYGLCTNMRLPVAFREYEAPYYPLSGPSHFGVKLVKGDEKLTTFQFLVTLTKQQEKTVGKIEFSSPGAAYERKVEGKMVYSDSDNRKKLVLSTEKFGKKASVEWNYNSVSNRAEMFTATDFFTPKEISTRIVFFNDTRSGNKETGIYYSTQYDWLKFEHVTKVVRKTSGYQLFSSTEYYPDQAVTGIIDYNTVDNKVTATLESNQLNQAVELTGKYTENGEEKGVVVSGKHVQSGKTITFYSGIVNTDTRKELIMTANVLGKTAKNILQFYMKDGVMTAENIMSCNGKIVKFTGNMIAQDDTRTVKLSADVVGNKAFTTLVIKNKVNEKSIFVTANAGKKTGNAKLGYYIESGLNELKFDFNILGHQGEIFAKTISSEGYRTTIGAAFDEYTAGVRHVYSGNHGHGKSLCSSLYYGKNNKEEEPVNFCIKFHSLGKSFIHKRITVSAELMGKNKKGELSFDFEKHIGHVTVGSNLKYNGDKIAKNVYSLRYSSDMNNELRMDVVVGKYKGGYKLFSSKSKLGANLGVEAYAMEQIVAYVMKYENVVDKEASEIKLSSEMYFNGKLMPITTETSLVTDMNGFKPSIKINVGDYTVLCYNLISYSAKFYGLDWEMYVSHKSENFIRVFTSTSLTLNERERNIKQKYGFTVLKKDYVYGWDASLENRGTKTKMAHAVTLGLQYSTTRRSSVTFVLTNTDIKTALRIKVEYIPNKQVSHYIKYNKKDMQVDVSVEFLPKMFMSLMTRLDSNNGYKSNTKMVLKWKNYKKVMTMVNTYINNNKKMEISTGFGKDIKLSLTYMKVAVKSLTLEATAFNNNVQLVGIVSSPTATLKLVVNEKMLFKAQTSYDQLTGDVEFNLANKNTKIFSIGKSFDKFTKEYSLQILGEQEWFKVVTSTKNGKNVMRIMSLGKQYARLVTSIDDDSVSINVAATQMNTDITFTGKINKAEKSMTISSTTGKNTCGFTLRADWVNLMLAEYLFCNDKKIGVELFAAKQSLNAKVILSPTMMMQVMWEVQNDNILKMTVRRSENNKMVNEVSFKYQLSKNMCHFAFNWNAETIKRFTNIIDKFTTKTVSKLSTMANKVASSTVKFVRDSAKNTAASAFNFINNLDRSFDEFDFIAARKQLSKMSIESLKKFAALVQTALKQLIKGLDQIKNNVPEFVEKVKQLQEKAKSYTLKANEMMNNLKGDFGKNFKEISNMVMLVMTNLTESTIPVVNKAITLMKEFKVRGKTMNEIVVLINDLATKYLKVYTKQVKVQLAEMKVKGIKQLVEASKYILKVKIPYRDETVEQVIEMIRQKVLEIKSKITNADIEKMIKEARVSIMEYKINGKTLTQHLVLLQKHLKDLPETTRKAIQQLIKNVRLYSRKVTAALTEINDFAAPMTNHVIFVGKSVRKHFGPLLKSSLQQVSTKLRAMQFPNVRSEIMKRWQLIEEFFLPLVKPIGPLYTNLKNQIRDIRVYGFSVGTMVDLNKDLLHDMLNSYMIMTKGSINIQMKKMNEIVDKITSMTAEEMVDSAFDLSKVLTTKSIDFAQQTYIKREKMINDLVKEMKKVYTKLTKQYQSMKKLSVNELVEESIHKVSDSIIATADELSNIIKQIVQLEISKPTWQAWKEANVLGHLESYGVNQKLHGFIQSAKKVNVTELASKTANTIAEYFMNLYGEAFVRFVGFVSRMEKVYSYIQTIPQKEYEQWFNELKEFALKNQKDITTFLSLAYEITEQRYKESILPLIKLSKISAEQINKDYVVPAKKIIKTIGEKSRLVYDDVKQPTIDVTRYYQKIFNDFVEAKYKIVKAILMKEYERVYAQLKTKINAMKVMMETKYEEFLNKYGDMSLEEIAEETYKYAKQQTKVTKKTMMKATKQLRKNIMKLMEKSKELYGKAVIEYTNYVKYLNDEVKPKIEKVFNDYKSMVTVETAKMKKFCKKTCDEIKSKVMTLYNNNKDKTIKAIYIEIKTALVKQMKQQQAIVVKLMSKKMKELATLSTKYITKVDVLMRTVILPEMKVEMESLINQTLRATVILGKETIKAYTPHFNLVKGALTDVSMSMKEISVATLEDSKHLFHKSMKKLLFLLNDLIVKIQNHELYTKMVSPQLVKLTNMYNDLMKLSKAKVEELKSHPTTLEYKQYVEEKLVELNNQISMYKKSIAEYYDHPNVAKVLKSMQKIKTSIMFTVQKLIKMYQPSLNNLITVSKNMLLNIPPFANKAFAMYVENPEVTFWNAVKTVKEITKEGVAIFSSIDTKELYESAKVFIRTEYKHIMKECFDQWTKDTARQLYNDAKKTIRMVENKIRKLPDMLKRMTIKKYRKTLFNMKMWYKNQYKTVKNQWKASPYRTFVINPIWEEIADEVMRHEFAEAVKDLAQVAVERFTELQTVVKKELANKQEMFKAKMMEMKIKLEEAKVQLRMKYEELKTNGIEQYKKLVEEYTRLVKKVEKFVEETTIADVVEYAKTAYVATVKKMKDVEIKFMELKKEYFEKSMDLYNMYKTKAMEMYNVYYDEGMNLIKNYKTKFMPMYQKYESKVMQAWNTQYPVIMEKFELYKAKSLAKYNELLETAMKMYEEYQVKAMKAFKKGKRQTMKTWKKSDVRAKLIELKKMSIRQIIVALKKLPAQTKLFVMGTYNKYLNVATTQLKENYKKLLNEMMKQKEEFFFMVKPITEPAYIAYKWIENEATETAVFVFKYYHLADKYTNAKNFITNEMKRLTPILEGNLKQYSRDVQTMSMKYLKEYQSKALSLAKDLSFNALDQTLRAVHSTLRYLNNIDVNEISNKAKSFYTAFTKYVSIDAANGEILINISHLTEVTPSFSHHFKKIGQKARRTVRSIKQQGNEMLEKINKQLNELKIKTDELRAKLEKQIMQSTAEIRSDLRTSYTANKKIVSRVYTKVQIIYKQSLNTAVKQYKKMKTQARIYLKKADRLSKMYYKQFMKMSSKAFIKAGEIFMDIYETPVNMMPTKISTYTVQYYKLAENKAMQTYNMYKPIVVKQYKKAMFNLKLKTKKITKQLRPYYNAITTAVKKLKAGVPIKTALNPIFRQMKFVAKQYNEMITKMFRNYKSQFCKANSKLCKLIKDSKKVHSYLVRKYVSRASNVMVKYTRKYAEGKAKFFRMIRTATLCFKKDRTTYRDVATIFGNKHVMTFDKTMYNLADIPSASCGYVLLNDFLTREFTVILTMKSIKIVTPQMKVEIFNGGKTVTQTSRKTIKSLPVETESGKCERVQNIIKCHFKKQQMKINMDLTNDVVTISVSGWHHGKLQGLLGTNNLESYDDMKLPSGKLAKSELELMNAYETSGNRKCQIKSTKLQPLCGKRASPKCAEVFMNKNSPFAEYFNTLETKAFLKACVEDTVGCVTKKTNVPAYCSSVNAFVQYARASGYSAAHLEECMKHGQHAIGSEWNIKTNSKHIDVVVMVSQRKSVRTYKKSIVKVMKNLQKLFKINNMDSRFSLIGFGGVGVKESAHVHALSRKGDVFGNVDELVRDMSRNMVFNGDGNSSNDAYEAILEATTQHFRPTAERVFVLFNTEPHTAYYNGPTYAESLYALTEEASASLFVFDEINFKTLNKRGETYGQTERKVYTSKFLKGFKSGKNELPTSSFKEMVKSSNGGIFTNKINRPKDSASMLFNAITESIKINQNICKSCVVQKTWYGVPRVVCQPTTRQQC